MNQNSYGLKFLSRQFNLFSKWPFHPQQIATLNSFVVKHTSLLGSKPKLVQDETILSTKTNSR